jgi:DNA-binding LacI/PurR family transcriptional regulator
VATVSRALLNYPQVNASTRARVVRAVRTLGYIPNRAAQSLVVRATQTLGLLIPDATDPMHGQFVAGFEEEAAAHDYTVFVGNGRKRADRERRALELFVMQRADGVTLIGSVLRQREVRALLRPSPAIFVNGEHPGLAGYRTDLATGCLRADDAAGVTAAVEHLLAMGCRRFAYAGGLGTASDITRRQAAIHALRRAAGRLRRLRTYAAMPGAPGSDAELAAAIAADGMDAVLCYDDKLAVSLLAALRARRLSVPDQIAVVGFDDIPFAKLSNPSLTTVAQPSVEMGRRAAAMVLEALRMGRLPASARLPVSLVIRGSSARSIPHAPAPSRARP